MGNSEEKVRIVIAEDHTVLREGLKHILQTHPGWEVVNEANDGLEAIRMVETLKPDLILMDLSMPRMNGIGAIQNIKRINPATRVLVLTVHNTEEWVLAAFKAGADGYALKDIQGDGLHRAIEDVLSGKMYISPGIGEMIIEGYLDGRKTLKTTSWETLTQREREILKMIAEGYKNQEIADYLQIAKATVVSHRNNLMKKLDLHSTSSLTAYAMEKGLIAK